MNKYNENILITGSTGGLGSEISKIAISEGYNVIGVNRGKHPKVSKNLIQFAKKNHVSYKNITTDLSNPKRLKNQLITNRIISDANKISYAVLCHGANFNYSFHKVSWDTIDESMRINFGASFIFSQYLVNQWIESIDLKKFDKKDRCIVYISSVAVKGASPDELAYHSAKSAMMAAMRSFVRQYTIYGIRFNVISPGLMDTQMGKKTLADRPDILERIPLGHLVGVGEVAREVLFILQSPSITGVDLDINAGRHVSI